MRTPILLFQLYIKFHEQEGNQPQEFQLEPAADPALELIINFAEQSEVSAYNK